MVGIENAQDFAKIQEKQENKKCFSPKKMTSLLFNTIFILLSRNYF